jgi:hypothetical protein
MNAMSTPNVDIFFSLTLGCLLIENKKGRKKVQPKVLNNIPNIPELFFLLFFLQMCSHHRNAVVTTHIAQGQSSSSPRVSLQFFSRSLSSFSFFSYFTTSMLHTWKCNFHSSMYLFEQHRYLCLHERNKRGKRD